MILKARIIVRFSVLKKSRILITVFGFFICTDMNQRLGKVYAKVILSSRSVTVVAVATSVAASISTTSINLSAPVALLCT